MTGKAVGGSPIFPTKILVGKKFVQYIFQLFSTKILGGKKVCTVDLIVSAIMTGLPEPFGP